MAEYSFKEYSVRLLGRDVANLVGLDWKWKDPKAYVRGKGNKPYGLNSTGEQGVEGTLKVQQSEWAAFVQAVRATNPLAKITDVSFDIVETYGDGLLAITNTLLGVQITEYNGGMEQGDAFKVIEMPFMALDVKEAV